MDDGIEAAQVLRLDRSRVLLDGTDGLPPRAERRPPIEVGVEPDDVMAGVDHHRSHHRPDVPTATRQQDPHGVSPT